MGKSIIGAAFHERIGSGMNITPLFCRIVIQDNIPTGSHGIAAVSGCAVTEVSSSAIQISGYVLKKGGEVPLLDRGKDADFRQFIHVHQMLLVFGAAAGVNHEHADMCHEAF